MIVARQETQEEADRNGKHQLQNGSPQVRTRPCPIVSAMAQQLPKEICLEDVLKRALRLKEGGY